MQYERTDHYSCGHTTIELDPDIRNMKCPRCGEGDYTYSMSKGEPPKKTSAQEWHDWLSDVRSQSLGSSDGVSPPTVSDTVTFTVNAPTGLIQPNQATNATAIYGVPIIPTTSSRWQAPPEEMPSDWSSVPEGDIPNCSLCQDNPNHEGVHIIMDEASPFNTDSDNPYAPHSTREAWEHCSLCNSQAADTDTEWWIDNP